MKQLDKYLPDNEQVIFRNPHNGRQTIVELWSNPIGQFTVRAGAQSDWSYTELIPNITNMEEMKTAISKKNYNNQLFK